IVKAFTDAIVTPLLSSVGAGGAGSETALLKIPLWSGQVMDLNLIVAAVINFLITAAVIFFVIVKPANKLIAMMQRKRPRKHLTPRLDLDPWGVRKLAPSR
ncbi:MAG: MscL family protein, partial [Armatimonadota bacterium]